jgi:hypothetical protein
MKEKSIELFYKVISLNFRNEKKQNLKSCRFERIGCYDKRKSLKERMKEREKNESNKIVK